MIFFLFSTIDTIYLPAFIEQSIFHKFPYLYTFFMIQIKSRFFFCKSQHVQKISCSHFESNFMHNTIKQIRYKSSVSKGGSFQNSIPQKILLIQFTLAVMMSALMVNYVGIADCILRVNDRLIFTMLYST